MPWASVELGEGMTALEIAATGPLRASLFARRSEPVVLDI